MRQQGVICCCQVSGRTFRCESLGAPFGAELLNAPFGATSDWPTRYTVCLGLALRAAGRLDSGWNRRFKNALYGLEMEQGEHQHQRDRAALYPSGGPLLAPAPAAGPGGWSDASLVCWGPTVRASGSRTCGAGGARADRTFAPARPAPGTGAPGGGGWRGSRQPSSNSARTAAVIANAQPYFSGRGLWGWSAGWEGLSAARRISARRIMAARS